jgi:hypothetical protein
MVESMLNAEPVKPEDKIRIEILKKLGHPANVVKVDVKLLHGTSYRVNVWTRTETDGLVAGHKITHSEVVKYKEHIPNV